MCFICDQCPHVEQTREELDIHIQTLHKTPRVRIEKISFVKCELCDYTCKLNIQLKRHLKANHQEFKSSNCDDAQYNKESKEMSTLCPFCKLESKDIEALKIHIENIHMNKPEKRKDDDTQLEQVDIDREKSNTCVWIVT